MIETQLHCQNPPGEPGQKQRVMWFPAGGQVHVGGLPPMDKKAVRAGANAYDFVADEFATVPCPRPADCPVLGARAVPYNVPDRPGTVAVYAPFIGAGLDRSLPLIKAMAWSGRHPVDDEISDHALSVIKAWDRGRVVGACANIGALVHGEPGDILDRARVEVSRGAHAAAAWRAFTDVYKQLNAGVPADAGCWTLHLPCDATLARKLGGVAPIDAHLVLTQRVHLSRDIAVPVTEVYSWGVGVFTCSAPDGSPITVVRRLLPSLTTVTWDTPDGHAGTLLSFDMYDDAVIGRGSPDTAGAGEFAGSLHVMTILPLFEGQHYVMPKPGTEQTCGGFTMLLHTLPE